MGSRSPSQSRSSKSRSSKASKSSPKKKTLREITVKYFQQEEIKEFFDNPKNLERQDKFSQLLFRAALNLSKKYDKKMDQLKFFQTLFTVVNQEKLSEQETKEGYKTLLESLGFEDEQQLRVTLLYYLHNYPKGNAVPGLSYKTILEKMIERGIVNNKKFLTEGTRLIEAITPEAMYREKLNDIISAFLFGTHQEYAAKKENKVKNATREELLKELKACREKLRKLGSL
jgi:hypothetical protein